MGTSYGTARRRPRGRARPAGVALTSRGRCRGRRCGRWTSRSEACRRARYGRKWTRRDGGREVLADRRLRRSAAKSLSEKDEDAGQQLDHLPVKSLTFSCEWCGPCATLKVAELIAMFGRERNVRSIGRHVLKCRDRRSRREGNKCPIILRRSSPQTRHRWRDAPSGGAARAARRPWRYRWRWQGLRRRLSFALGFLLHAKRWIPTRVGICALEVSQGL